MSNIIKDSRKVFVFWKILTIIAAFECAYGFIFSPDQGHRNVTPLLIVSILSANIDLLNTKRQKASLIAGLVCAAVAAAVVILNVGIWILNIRYIAIVYAVFMAAYSAAQLIVMIKDKDNR